MKISKKHIIIVALPVILLASPAIPGWKQATLALSVPETRAIQISLNPSQSPQGTKEKLAYEIKPTKSLEDVLTIRNYSPDQSFNLKVYAVDAIQSTDGAIAFKLEDRVQQLVGLWTTFGQRNVTLAPGKTLYLPYRINVPEKIAPGTYQGGLVVEVINPEPSTGNGQTDIKVLTRLIEPVYVSVPGRKILKYNLDEFSYTESNGIPCFFIKFSNQGNVFLTGEVNVDINGTLLDNTYKVSLNHPTILQEESMEKTFRFENPPLFGEYNAELTFKVYEYNPLTNIPQHHGTIKRRLHFIIIPYPAIFAFIIIVALLITAIILCKKHLKKRLDETFTHIAKKNETIISIAELYQVNWKKIVKLNKLKRPYTIHPGDRLTLPFPQSAPSTRSGKKRR